MASFPMPSFFKIRGVVIILSFLAFCFVVGFVKDVRSEEKGYFYIITSDYSPQSRICPCRTVKLDQSTGDFVQTSVTTNCGPNGDSEGLECYYSSTSVYTVSYTYDACRVEDSLLVRLSTENANLFISGALFKTKEEFEAYKAEHGCPEPTCEDKGRGYDFWVGFCASEGSEIIPESYSEEYCSATCKDGDCSDEYNEAVALCGEGNVEQIGYECDYGCKEPPPPDENCPELHDKAVAECNAIAEVNGLDSCVLDGFFCEESEGQIIHYDSGSCNCQETPDPPDPDPDPDPIPDPSPDPDPDPDPGDGDDELGALNKILDETISIDDESKKINTKLSDMLTSQKIIGENNAEQLSGIYNKLDGIEDAIEGIESWNGDDLEDLVRGISDGTYTEPEEESPYGVSESSNTIGTKFGDRTTSFFNAMKTTGPFSLPSQLATSIPGGGSPTLTISTGETFGGDHTIDFSTWSNGLMVIRGFLQIMGMFMAIKIVCKGGA